MKIDSSYLDRMREWDNEKLDNAWKLLSRGLDSPDKQLLAFVESYFGIKPIAVRTVYYYNASTGFDCPRIDYIYKE